MANYTQSPSPDGGTNYFRDGQPVTREEYNSNTGFDLGAAIDKYVFGNQSADVLRGVDLGGSFDAGAAINKALGDTSADVFPNMTYVQPVDNAPTDGSYNYTSGGDVLGTNTGGSYTSGGTSGGTTYSAPVVDPQIAINEQTKAANNAYLDNQATQLRDLLTRTDTGLTQGTSKIGSEYTKALADSNVDKTRQLGIYDENRVTQNTGKQDSYNTVNRNANNGYRSLAQIIGRASGTGSSAYRDMLPNVIGTDISSKRKDIADTYGANLRGIDKSQNEYTASFADVLKDLLNQKKLNEQDLNTGIETQRQGINSQLSTNAAQRVQNNEGDYAAVQAAQAPYQTAIDNSRNSVEGFFNTYKPDYTPKTAAATAPQLSKYTIDRSNVNAQGQPGFDPTNPYASLLRRRLLEENA